ALPDGGWAISRFFRIHPTPFAGPMKAAGTDALIASLTTISPAPAVASISVVTEAAGPVTISSLCVWPTRKQSMLPVWTPEDILREILPTDVDLCDASL